MAQFAMYILLPKVVFGFSKLISYHEKSESESVSHFIMPNSL